MDPKLIKENAEIIAVLASRWDRTGEINDVDKQYLLTKIAELNDFAGFAGYNEVKPAIGPEEPIDEVPEVELTGFTITIGQDDQYSGSGADNNLEKEAADTLLAEEDEVPANTDTEAAEPAEDEASDKVTDPETGTGDHAVEPGHSRRGKTDRRTIRALYEDDDAASPESGGKNVEEGNVGNEEDADTGHMTDKETEMASAEADEPLVDDAESAPESKGAADLYRTNSAPEQKVVLGDVINQGNHVLGDSIGSGEHSRVVNDRVSDIRSALGVNDRYLIIHELFGGNASEFESVVSRLDTFPDLDNAMLWIYDNYDWDPDNQGAKLIIDILVRKLS